MKDIVLKNLEKTTEQDLDLIKDLKLNYRKVNPLEALIHLGNMKEITRIVDFPHSGKVLQSIFVKSEKDYFDNLYYHLGCDGFGFSSSEILKEILEHEWFVKL